MAPANAAPPTCSTRRGTDAAGSSRYRPSSVPTQSTSVRSLSKRRTGPMSCATRRTTRRPPSSFSNSRPAASHTPPCAASAIASTRTLADTAASGPITCNPASSRATPPSRTAAQISPSARCTSARTSPLASALPACADGPCTRIAALTGLCRCKPRPNPPTQIAPAWSRSKAVTSAPASPPTSRRSCRRRCSKRPSPGSSRSIPDWRPTQIGPPACSAKPVTAAPPVASNGPCAVTASSTATPPCCVPTQMRPSAAWNSACTLAAAKPLARTGSKSSPAGPRRLRPCAVPTHKVPARSTTSACTRSFGKLPVVAVWR